MPIDYDVLGTLKIKFGIPYISVTFLDIAEQVNHHSNMALRMMVPETVSLDDVHRCEESAITVSRGDGNVIFSGIATFVSLSHTAGYQEVLVTAKSYSILADKKRESGTFQNTGKTLAEVAHVVLDPCGVRVTIPQDMPLEQMLSRENETAWEFIRRIANEQGLYVYADSKALEPHISIGLEPFSVFPYHIFEMQSEEKDIADFMAMQANIGAKVSSFQMAKQSGISPELQIGVGCQLNSENRT